ncbi:hypothetical protein [Paenibacillus sp. KS-LC4]
MKLRGEKREKAKKKEENGLFAWHTSHFEGAGTPAVNHVRKKGRIKD